MREVAGLCVRLTLTRRGHAMTAESPAAGCSLADAVTGDDLADRKAELRKAYPDLAVVGYVNTTAEVKAECDACCTSSNAVAVVEAMPSQHILFVPDKNLAAYVQSKTTKEIIAWDG